MTIHFCHCKRTYLDLRPLLVGRRVRWNISVHTTSQQSRWQMCVCTKCVLQSGWLCLTSRPILGRCGSLTVYACVHAGVKGENEALSSWLSTCSVENWTDTFEAQRCNWLQLRKSHMQPWLNPVVLISQVPDSPTISDLSGGSLPVVLTTDVQRGLDMFSPWLQGSNKHPFIVVGPEGCGKEWVLTHNIIGESFLQHFHTHAVVSSLLSDINRVYCEPYWKLEKPAVVTLAIFSGSTSTSITSS